MKNKILVSLFVFVCIVLTATGFYAGKKNVSDPCISIVSQNTIFLVQLTPNKDSIVSLGETKDKATQVLVSSTTPENIKSKFKAGNIIKLCYLIEEK